MKHIAQTQRVDRRTKKTIMVKNIGKGVMELQIGFLTLHLKTVEAKRIGDLLVKSVDIQNTHRTVDAKIQSEQDILSEVNRPLLRNGQEDIIQ